ncbi:MAG: MarR family transcriptional regulator [Archangiaceae bacterium]|nr:MarR family transcriptional regulator [Archangiaceae bacterium]
MSGTLSQAEDLFIELVGSAMEFWGFKRILGNVWAVLYLSEEGLTATALGERLNISKAAVSTAVAELERWGCVRRERSPGERAEVLIAEQDIWRMVSRVFRERELRMIERSVETLDKVLRLARGDSTAHARFLVKRLEKMTTLARLAMKTLQLLLDRGKADLTGLRQSTDE